MLYGAVEAGGTKFVCAVGNENLEVIERISFPTETPDTTLKNVVAFFKKFNDIQTIGVGSFGPIDIHHDSETYGYITSTPKLSWENCDVVGYLKQHLPNSDITWTTDVNAACYGEYVAGHGQGKSSVVYYTIGTGVGAGAIQNGQFIEGFSHPEMGHMLVRRHDADTYKGHCPYHKDCLEGLAAGPAIEQRTGIKGQYLLADDPSWDMVAYYVAQCIHNTTLMFSPDVIIFGGGVMQQAHLRTKVKEKFAELMNNYVAFPNLDEYIVAPKLKDNAGIVGCLALARDFKN